MRKSLFLLLVLPIFCLGQKNSSLSGLREYSIDQDHCRSDFRTVHLDKINSNSLKDHLTKTLDNLRERRVTLSLIDSIASKTGTHYLFQQHYNGIPIYRAQVKVNCDKKNNIQSLFDNTYSHVVTPEDIFPSTIKDNYISSLQNVEEVKAEKNYFSSENKLIPVWKIEVLRNNSNDEVLLDANNNIVYNRDMSSYFAPPLSQDSTVSALVFLPDPLTTAGLTYGLPYEDYHDSDVTQLNAQRVNINMKVFYSGDTFYLKSAYVKIRDFDGPTIAPVYSYSNPTFYFTRAQSGFEDVNVYYHINIFQEHIQNLGFTNLVNYPIEIDTHGMNGADNSQFLPVSKRLSFGEGNIDDAEDADVIIHEYGHAISHSAAPNTNTGTQRLALDEANSDYFASSYSRFLNPYRWEYVYSWDGQNPFWDGRMSVSTKQYPQDLVFNLYDDADIWSSTIMEIWGDIGRNKSDEILLESMYGYATNMTMADAAVLYIQADSNLYNGQHYSAICNRFSNRGLVTACIIGIDDISAEPPLIINSSGFAIGETAVLQFSQPTNAIVKIMDVQGKYIFEEQLNNSYSAELKGSLFTSGVYIVSVQCRSGNFNFKLIRF